MRVVAAVTADSQASIVMPQLVHARNALPESTVRSVQLLARIVPLARIARWQVPACVMIVKRENTSRQQVLILASTALSEVTQRLLEQSPALNAKRVSH